MLKTGPLDMNLLEFCAFHEVATETLEFIVELLPELSIHEAILKMISLDHSEGFKALLCLNFPQDRLLDYLFETIVFKHSFCCASVLLKSFPDTLAVARMQKMSIAQYALSRYDWIALDFLCKHGSNILGNAAIEHSNSIN